MGKVKSMIPSRSKGGVQASDYICNARWELSMVRGAVRVALMTVNPDKDGPSPEEVYGFLELLDYHFDSMEDQLNAAQSTVDHPDEIESDH